MPGRSVTHATFTVERVYDATPERVFAAYTTKEARLQWFAGEPADWEKGPYELDFREGGRESASGKPPNGKGFRYNALYWEIMPNERVVSTYEMHLGEDRISVSLATVEIRPEGAKTRLVYTEQGAFLDGFDDPRMREQGVASQLESLVRFV